MKANSATLLEVQYFNNKLKLLITRLWNRTYKTMLQVVYKASASAYSNGGLRIKREQGTYHSASIVHVVNVPVGMGTEVYTSGDPRERTTFSVAKPTVWGCMFKLYLKNKKRA